MKNKEPFDLERIKEEALEGLYNGEKLVVPMVYLRPC